MKHCDAAEMMAYRSDSLGVREHGQLFWFIMDKLKYFWYHESFHNIIEINYMMICISCILCRLFFFFFCFHYQNICISLF